MLCFYDFDGNIAKYTNQTNTETGVCFNFKRQSFLKIKYSTDFIANILVRLFEILFIYSFGQHIFPRASPRENKLPWFLLKETLKSAIILLNILSRRDNCYISHVRSDILNAYGGGASKMGGNHLHAR